MKSIIERMHLRKVFTFLLIIPLNLAPLVNFPTPAHAEGCTGYRVEVHKNGSRLSRGADGKCYKKEEINGVTQTIKIESSAPTTCNSTATAGEMWDQCITVTFPSGNQASFGATQFLKNPNNAITHENLAVEIALWEVKDEEPVRKASSNAKFDQADGYLVAQIKTTINDDGGYSSEASDGEGGTASESETGEEAAEEAAQQAEEAAAASGGTNKQMEKRCKKAVGVLGWILCPVIFIVAEGVSDTYTTVEENFMQIRSGIFTDSLSSAWGTFRSIANIFFIVLFLIVILSQLTGVGIDNYGIKRIMPRLIIVAVLINLSYIVCQLTTDISNIIGRGAVSTMQELSGDFNGVDGDSYIQIAINKNSSQFIRIVLSKAGGGFAGAGELLLILFCLVIAFVCILVIWVFCLARDIGIIAMVVTAPVAFACMLLPNTEGVYKKWFTLSKILWTLYPICGITIGAGSFAAAILYNSINAATGGTFLAGVTALFAATIPFIAIPYLLLNTLSALGTIGNKIAGLGRKTITVGAAAGLAGSRIKRAYKESNFVYNKQQNREHKIDMKRVNQAKRVSERLSGQDPATLSNRQLERLARANQTIDKNNERQSAIRYATSAGYLERRAQGREDMERRKREEDVMAQITNGTEFKDEHGNPINYRRGTDINAMNDRLITLLNMGDRATAAQVTERGALIRQMARTKGGDKKLAMLAYDGNLDDTGIATFNNHRLQNSDVSSVIAGKNSVGAALLNDLAAGRAERIHGANGEYEIVPYRTNNDGSLDLSAGHPVRADNQQFSKYVSGVLANTNDIASQSTGAINRYGSMLPEAQVRELVNNPQFETLVPDYEKRQALLNTPTVRQQNIERNQQAMNEARDAEQARVFAQQQTQYDQQVAQENEVFRVQEENSRNDTRGTVQQNINGTNHTVYRVPKWRGGFTGNNGSWSINNNNEAIYTEGNLSWNGTTGRIQNLNPRQVPTPPPAAGSQPDVQGPPRPPHQTQ